MTTKSEGMRSVDAEPVTAPIPGPSEVPPRTLTTAGLQSLIDALAARGYTVIGPTVSGGAIVNAPIRSIDDLPRGWGDEQEAAHYRLRRRDDDAFFGFAAGAQSAKPVFFPTDELLWRAAAPAASSPCNRSRTAAAARRRPVPTHLIGVRSCDLHAIAIHDRVLTGRLQADAHYVARRDGAFIVSVSCTDPGGTCFCVSMGTGPRPEGGVAARFDLSLTELLDGGVHRFVVEVGSERGRRGRSRTSRRPRHRSTISPRRTRWPPPRPAGWAAASTPTGSRNCCTRAWRAPAGMTSRPGAWPAPTARWSARPASAPP